MVAMLSAQQLRKLMSYSYVVDVENEGMEDDRFFVHLDMLHRYDQDQSSGVHSKAFSSYKDARFWLDKKVITFE